MSSKEKRALTGVPWPWAGSKSCTASLARKHCPSHWVMCKSDPKRSHRHALATTPAFTVMCVIHWCTKVSCGYISTLLLYPAALLSHRWFEAYPAHPSGDPDSTYWKPPPSAWGLLGWHTQFAQARGACLVSVFSHDIGEPTSDQRH